MLPWVTDTAAETKTPPHALQAEQAVLGALLQDNSAWERIADRLNEVDFYRLEHRLLFAAIRELAEAGQPFDVVTLADWLSQRQRLDGAGGLSYLASLAQNTPSASNIVTYADIVRERALLRELIRTASDVAQMAHFPKGQSSREILDKAEAQVFAIAERHARGGGGFIAIKPILARAVQRIEQLNEQDNPITGVATGFDDFDQITSGLQPSDLVIVAGRPAMGKTSFAMNIVEHVILHTKRPAAVFSMEMSGEQLATRLLSSLGRVDQSKVRTGRIAEDEWPRIASAIHLLSGAPLFIDDTPALTPTELRARARRLKREQRDLGLVMIDYLQLMQVAGGGESRANEISEISRSLKALARELHVPVLALSQLNRNLEQRPNKRPVMSDLRESGSIEQDADVIVFIYRDEVYNENSQDKGVAEIIIGKQRNGPTGTVRLTFLGQHTRFENYLAPETYSGLGVN